MPEPLGIEHWRALAAEVRELSEQTDDQEARRQMRRIAAHYDKLAAYLATRATGAKGKQVETGTLSDGEWLCGGWRESTWRPVGKRSTAELRERAAQYRLLASRIRSAQGLLDLAEKFDGLADKRERREFDPALSGIPERIA